MPKTTRDNPPAPIFKARTARFRTALFRTDVCNTAPPLTGLTDTLPSRFENSPGEVVTSCRCRCAVDGERRTRRRSLSSPLSSTDNIYPVVFTRVVACARPSHTCRLRCRAPVVYRVLCRPCYGACARPSHTFLRFFFCRNINVCPTNVSGKIYVFTPCLGTVFFLCAFCVVDPVRVVSFCLLC